MTVQHITGKNKGRIMLYTLSTCVWCKKTKQLLNDLGVEYDYADIDTLQGDEKTEILKAMKKWNPSGNFPTMVINDKNCIIGFREDAIREALQL